MDKKIKEHGFVVCETKQGRMVENGSPARIKTSFNQNSVAEVREIGAEKSRVYVIGEDAEYIIPNAELKYIDPLKTGKGYSKKICNICHVLKPHSGFAVNQTDAKGGKTSRPSCRVCRRNIDQKPMSPAAKKQAEKERPKKGTLWKCPICRKRSIVGVTAKVVLDHRHSDGTRRMFLCDSCNTGLGRFKNGENYLRNALAYLEEFEKSRGARTPGQS